MAAAPSKAGSILGSRITARLPRYVALGVVLVALSVLAAGAAAAPAESLGAAAQQPSFTATPLVPVSRVEGFKSASGQLAQTDESLLGPRSDEPVNVVVKLDYDAVASYAGQIDGLPATSPSVTGEPLNMRSDASQDYLDYVRGIEQQFLSRLDARVPDADVGRVLRVAYGGIALTVPGNEIDELLKLPGVAAVQDDSPREAPHRLEPRLHRRPDDLRPARRQRQRGREGRHRRHPRHRRLAGASVLRRSRHPAGPAAEGRRHASDLQLRRQPADAGDRCVRLPAEADLGSALPRHLQRRLRRRGLRHQRARLERPRLAHLEHLGRRAGREREPARHQPRPDPRRRTRRRTSPSTRTAARRAASPRTRPPPWPRRSSTASRSSTTPSPAARIHSATRSSSPSWTPTRRASSCPRARATTARARRPTTTTRRGSPPSRLRRRARTFRSTVTLNGTGGATLQIAGATITAGIGSPLPVVLGSAPPYNNVGCTAPAPPGLFTGKIVACERGPGRIIRGFNVRQGGAVGMILYNATALDVMTDNHWLPTVHVDDAREPSSSSPSWRRTRARRRPSRRARRRPGRATASPTSRRAAPEGTG